MCIIVAKPAGVDLPTEEILDNCYTSNRDGIGFAFNKPGGTPIISKGFANVKKLLKMFHVFNISKEDNVLLHFRTATHGKKDQGNCHPFPLTMDLKEMRELHLSCDVAVTHNGVFGSMKVSDTYSDTMKFIGTILASPEIIANLDSKPVCELIRGYCGHSSKLAFLRPQGINRIGDFEESEGIFYSNAQYKSWGNRNVTYYNNHSTHHNHNNFGYQHGSQWCHDHKAHDFCHNFPARAGKTWCYLHEAYDHCQYCSLHKQVDLCEYNGKKVSEYNKKHSCEIDNLLDLRKPTCEWCNTTDGVEFNNDLSANVCDVCVTLHMNGH